jgi:ABC-2 type transport system permease protein
VRTIFFLVRKEFLQIFRDRTTVFQIFMIPVVQLLVLANAATFDVKQVALLVVDEDHTTVSAGLVQRLEAGRQFRVVRYTSSDAGVDQALLDRQVTAVLHVPRRFEEDLVRRGRASVQLVLNAEEGATTGLVQSYAASILSAYARELDRTLPSARTGMGARVAPLDLRTQRWFNPTRNYKYWMVPALLVSLTTIIGLLLKA